MQSVFPKSILKKITQALSANYISYEAESLAYIILEYIFSWSKTDILVNEGREIESDNEVDLIVQRLLKNEPIQHILGQAEFYGRQYYVNEHVLIPRQETEELIELVKLENPKSGLSILDIGTGSGCISCSLFHELNQPIVHAIDVSRRALEMAQKNAENLECDIVFIHADILNGSIEINSLDIIVSNPPYVTENDKKLMHQNVLNHEPGLALFVSDEEPLVFYDKISRDAKVALKSGGKLYFEINELFGKEVALLMEQTGFRNVQIYKDLNGKDRFVSGILKII